MKYQWQGIPVKVKHVMVKIAKDTERNLFWFNYECDQDGMGHSWAILSAILIETPESSFIISNHFGIGVHKLINGGWPSHAHFSIPKESILEIDDKNVTRWNEFDEILYSYHEAHRKQWQRDNFPKEFAQSESLRRLIVKNHKNRS